ncbi:phage tail fiber protein [Nocardia sp. IFM 10818]
MALPNSTKQALADEFAQLGGTGTAWLSLHSADPTTVGDKELTGGNPAYERVQFTWSAGTNGTVSGPPVQVNCPAGSVTHAGIWKDKASKAPTDFIAGAQLSPTQTLGGDGPVTITPVFTVS